MPHPHPLRRRGLGFESHRLGERRRTLAGEQGVRRLGDAAGGEHGVPHPANRGDGPQPARRVHNPGVHLDGLAVKAHDRAGAGVEPPVVLHDDDSLDRRVEGVCAVTKPGESRRGRGRAAAVERRRGARTAMDYDGSRHCISSAGRPRAPDSA